MAVPPGHGPATTRASPPTLPESCPMTFRTIIAVGLGILVCAAWGAMTPVRHRVTSEVEVPLGVSAPQVIPPAVPAPASTTAAVSRVPTQDPMGAILIPAQGTSPAIRRVQAPFRTVPSATPRTDPAATEDMVADQIVVRLRSGSTSVQAEAMAKRHGGWIRRKLRVGNAYLVAFAAPDADALPAMQRALVSDPLVLTAEPDHIIRLHAVPSDPRFTEQWALRNTGQTGGKPGADIHASEAWQVTGGSHGILVGVIDSGLDRTHPDLQGNLWSNPGESGLDANGQDRRSNGIDDDGNGYIDDWQGWDFVANDNNPEDGHGHGTHCAGVIGAGMDNGVGIVGVCHQVSIVGLRFLDASGFGTESSAAEAIHYSTLIGCNITSNSWGGSFTSSLINEAVAEADATRQVFVAAAGNSSANTDATPSCPACIDQSNVISVAATNASDELAWFSNFGSNTVDIGAPGVEILSTLPGNAYDSWNGTSMATPHVSATAALLMALQPDLAPADVRELLMASGDSVASLVSRTVSGARLNAGRALAFLQARDRGPDVFPTDGVLPAKWDRFPTASQNNWQIITDPVYEGGFALRSGAVAAGEASAISVDGTWTEGDVVFAVRVSSAADHGILEFQIDGAVQGAWSGEVPWTSVAFPVPSGHHELRWVYRNQDGVIAGADAAWLDAVVLPTWSPPPEVFPPSQQIPEGWISAPAGSSAAWTVSSETAYEGAYSLRSGAVAAGQSSALAVSGIWSGGQVSFAARVSSHSYYAGLSLRVDGVTVGQWSGESGWFTANFSIPSGYHTVSWCYQKYGDAIAGQDAAWIDDVRLSGLMTGDLPEDIFPQGGVMPAGWLTMPSGSAQPWTVNADTASEGTHCLRSGAIQFGQSTIMAVGGEWFQGEVTCDIRAMTGTGVSFLRVLVDGWPVREWSGEVPWTSVSVAIPDGYHTVAWTVDRDPTWWGPGDLAWVDLVELNGFTMMDPPLPVADAFPQNDALPTGWQSNPSNSASPWTVVSDVSSEGTHALRSGAVTGTQSSVISTYGQWTGGRLSFDFQTRSSWNFNRLNLVMDGTVLESWTGHQRWRRAEFSIPDGIHTISWEFQRTYDNFFNVDEAAWIDRVDMQGFTQLETPPPAPDVFPPENAIPAGWTSGDLAWQVADDESSEGTHSLRSATIGHGQQSAISVTGFWSGGTVSFARRVESEPSWDALQFRIDDQVVGQWSGDVPWTVGTYAIPDGNHTISWVYAKDASGSLNRDAAWIDAVELVGFTPGGATSDVFPVDGVMPAGWSTTPEGSSQPWSVTTDTASEGTHSLRSGAIQPGEYSILAIAGQWAQGSVSFDARTATGGGASYLGLLVDGVPVHLWSGDMPWTSVSFAIPDGYHRLAWRLESDPSWTGPDEFAWIDRVVLDGFTMTDPPPPTPEWFPPEETIPAGWETSSPAWLVTTESAWEGVRSLRSAPIANSQQSAISLSGHWSSGMVSFGYRVASEPSYDFLQFRVDGNVVQQWSGDIPWTQTTFVVPDGIHTISWVYSKDGSVDQYQDAAWIDGVELIGFTPGGSTEEIFPVGGTMPVGWNSTPAGSSQPWSVTASTVSEGLFALQSGAILPGQSSLVSVAGVWTGGVVTCDVRASTMVNSSFLRLLVDGVVVREWTGEVPWSAVSATIPDGFHTVSWTVDRDPFLNGGSDRAWIDRVVLSGFAMVDPPAPVADIFPPKEAIPDQWEVMPVGSSQPWQVVSGTASEGTHALRSGAIGAGQNSAITINGTWSGGSLMFDLQTLTAVDRNVLRLELDGQVIGAWSGHQRWRHVEMSIPDGDHSLTWRLLRDPFLVSVVDEAAWIDHVQTVGCTLHEPPPPAPDVFPPAAAIPAGWVTEEPMWRVVTDNASEGAHSLRSGQIGHSQRSSIGVRGHWTGGSVSFARRVSSEYGFDYLQLRIDDVVVQQWSGNVPWTTGTFAVPDGDHTVSWVYTKDGSVTTGQDAAWIDAVQCIGMTEIQDRFPLDHVMPAGWVSHPSGTDAGWLVAKDEAWEGTESLRTDLVSGGQSAGIEVAGTWFHGPVGFRYRTSSENPLDVLHFTVDGVPQPLVTGSGTWNSFTMELDDGPHVLRWEFQRDSTSTSTAAAWIDDVILPQRGDGEIFPPQLTIPHDWTRLPTHSDLPWRIVNGPASEGLASLASGQILEGQTSALEVQGCWSTGTVRFARRVASEPEYDSLRFLIDGEVMDAWSGSMNWAEVEYPVTPGMHTFRWEYVKDRISSAYDDGAWIDAVVLPPRGSALHWAAPASIPPTEAVGERQLNATAGIPGVFTYDPPAGTLLPPGNHTLTAHFQPEDSGTYPSEVVTVTLTVLPASAVVTVSGLQQVYDGTPRAITVVTDPPGLQVQVTYDGESAIPTRAGAYLVQVTVVDPAYVGSAVRVLSVERAVPFIRPPAIITLAEGTPLGADDLRVATGMPGTWTWTPSAGTVLPLGSHRVMGVFQPDDAGDYHAVTVHGYVVVVPLEVAESASSKDGKCGAANSLAVMIAGFLWFGRRRRR